MRADLVVTDLDGTLWESDAAVHPRTQRAVSDLGDAGVPLLVATGRRVSSTKRPLSTIGLAPPAVVLNGALGLDLDSGERFHRRGFRPGEATTVLETFLRLGVDPCVYVDDDRHSVCVSPTPSTHPGHLASLGDEVREADLLEVVGSVDVLAFGVLGITENDATALGEALAAVARPHVDRDRGYGGHTVTVAPLSQSKWDGVAAFCALHGFDEGAVVALGDGPNDVELLEKAAVSVVPEDAHPAALALADHVIGRAADGGWADLMPILGL